jgi:NADPH:quinone reductase-like Zn-dependent oxidoreductase
VSPASAIVVAVDHPNALHALGLLAGMVAYRAAVDLAAIETGETVLLYAEASAVAYAAIQIARYRGGIVLATASSAERRDVLAKWGASGVFDPHRIDLASAVMTATNGRGVDTVICARDGAVLHQSVGLLARYRSRSSTSTIWWRRRTAVCAGSWLPCKACARPVS